MITNFPHSKRMHCETGTIKNLMAYHGLIVSETMVFGVGSGHFFLHFPWCKINDADMLLFRTKPTLVSQRFTKRLGMRYNEFVFKKDAIAAMQKLDELLEKNIPVCLLVGLMRLPYLNQIGIQAQFNGHIITVLGKENDNYIISDSDMKLLDDNLVTLSSAELRVARYPEGMFPPNGKMFYIDSIPAHLEITHSSIIEGMKEACKNMLDIPFPFFGVKGIHYFSKKLRNWEKKYDKEYIINNFKWYDNLIERAGTGGSGHRYMYGDFLKESAEIFQSEEIEHLSQAMNKAADTWREFTINTMHYTKSQNVTLTEIADIVDEAAEYESQTFVGLRKWIKSNKCK